MKSPLKILSGLLKFKISRLLGAILVSYVLFVGWMYIFQRNLIYTPDLHPAIPAEWGAADMAVVNVTTEDRLHLHFWYKPAKSRHATLVFFHGNAHHLGDRIRKVRHYLDHGYGILLVSYRGYGGNPGSPTETGLYKDARAALLFLKERNIPPSHIILYGESLGTGVAVHEAWELSHQGHPPLALILEAPFTTLPDAGSFHYPYLPVQWLTWDRFDSLSHIKDIHTPLLIIHGTADTVVPFSLSQRLYHAASEPKQVILIPGAQHNNLYSFGAAWKILKFLKDTERNNAYKF